MKKLVLAAMILGTVAVSPSLARAAIVPEYYTVTLEFTSTAGGKQKADLKCHRGKTCRATVKLSFDGKMEEIAFVSKVVSEEALEVRLESHVMGVAATIDPVGTVEAFEPGKSWDRSVIKTTRIVTPQKWDKKVAEKGVVRFTLK